MLAVDENRALFSDCGPEGENHCIIIDPAVYQSGTLTEWCLHHPEIECIIAIHALRSGRLMVPGEYGIAVLWLKFRRHAYTFYSCVWWH